MVTARQVAGRSAPEMFWRAKLGWGGIYEQSSGDGLALGGAMGAKSVVPFPQFGLLQGLPSACHCSLSPRQNLVHPQLQPLASPPASLSQSTWRADAA